MFETLGILILLLLLGGSFYYYREHQRQKSIPIIPPKVEEELAPVAPPGDLFQRLSKSRNALAAKLGALWSGPASRMGEVSGWEAVEEGLLEADVGIHTASALLEKVRARVGTSNGTTLRELIHKECLNLLEGYPPGFDSLDFSQRPLVISIVGINGAGKTTTIGKIAYQFQVEGKSVLLGATDTFRAAAISQLRVWAERSNAQFVSGKEGGDPGAVAFDAVTAAKARGMDVVLLDTAGRLHTKTNLMEELKKVHRVVKKVIPEAPHETWLILDGTLGQNSIQQAREFSQALGVTALIITKLDGTAKGGAVLAIAHELKLPVRFIGVGEGATDLLPFKPEPFVSALLGK